VLSSVDKNFVLKKIKIQGHGETPGLGDEIEKEYFLKQFEGKSSDQLVVIKGETEDNIEAITGATISTRAVAEDGVRKGVEMLEERLSKGVVE
jgi:electron transport complex protein RnfG